MSNRQGESPQLGSGMPSLPSSSCRPACLEGGRVVLMSMEVQKGHSMHSHPGAQKGLPPRLPIRQCRSLPFDAARELSVQRFRAQLSYLKGPRFREGTTLWPEDWVPHLETGQVLFPQLQTVFYMALLSSCRACNEIQRKDTRVEGFNLEGQNLSRFHPILNKRP